MRTPLRPLALLFVTAATGASLSGCKLDNRPSAASYAVAPPAPGPLDPAAAPAAYDPGYAQPDLAHPVGYLAPDQAYAYPARAWRTNQTYRDRPPSYAFDYGQAQPWAWASADDDWMVAEPYDDGYRTYYYEPGGAYPYFVQDADYGYAYGSGGALIALFDAAGALVSSDRYATYAPRARDDWRRGYDLGRAYRDSPRIPVQATVWRERAPAVLGRRDRWFEAAAAQPNWREAPVAHDNGRHLGWERGRRAAQVSGPAMPPDWRHDRGGRAWREAQASRPPQARVEHADRGRHGGGEAHPAFASAAAQHGKDAAFHGQGHGPDHAPHDKGGGDHGNHGGGDHGDHGGGKGHDKGPDKGDGHGKH